MRMMLTAAVAAPLLALGFAVSPALAIDEAKLDTILEARAEADTARDQYRHPKETLAFFGIEPDMSIVEAMPGGGWYTRILLPYVMDEGTYQAFNYRPGTFGSTNEERLERMRTWPERFPAQAADYVDGEPDVTAFLIASAPQELAGTVDAVLFFRALHGLFRAGEGEFLEEALTDTFTLLKPGGIVGVVQHRAPDGNPDDWANGDNGYLKQSAVIARFEEAGFELVGTSEINANPADQPTVDDRVWRLPPVLRGGDETQRDAYLAIGESDRMTVLFRKPE